MDHNIALASNYVKQKKAEAKNKCTSIVGHFVGYTSAWSNIDGIARCGMSRTPPSGVYSLCIAPTAARARANKQQ